MRRRLRKKLNRRAFLRTLGIAPNQRRLRQFAYRTLPKIDGLLRDFHLYGACYELYDRTPLMKCEKVRRWPDGSVEYSIWLVDAEPWSPARRHRDDAEA